MTNGLMEFPCDFALQGDNLHTNPGCWSARRHYHGMVGYPGHVALGPYRQSWLGSGPDYYSCYSLVATVDSLSWTRPPSLNLVVQVLAGRGQRVHLSLGAIDILDGAQFAYPLTPCVICRATEAVGLQATILLQLIQFALQDKGVASAPLPDNNINAGNRLYSPERPSPPHPCLQCPGFFGPCP
jgi:hypothetical protein